MNDDRLREVFADLRREETAGVPQFNRLWHGRRGGRLSTQFAFALLLLAIVAVSVIPIVRRHHTPQSSITEWRAPTDFLLKTPGQELLTSVPDLKGTTQ
jgi:hypothetical protein